MLLYHIAKSISFSLHLHNELCEVIELAKQGKISHSIQEFPLSEINRVADMLRNGEIKGRAVIVPKK